MNEIIELINEMSPYLLLGFLLAGLMHAFVPSTLYTRYLSSHSIGSVINAAIFGIPLPLCSCGVIPTAMSLRREGASKGATVSFLIATPQTGVDSIIATFSLMGLPFAVVRPITALLTAVFGGTMVNVVEKKDESVSAVSKKKGDCCHKSFGEKLKDALRYAFIEMMEDIGKWLVIGLVVAGLITICVPDSFFEIFKDNTFLSMLLVMAVSVPMYLCATGSIPIAVALMLKGLTPGAALVMLMAGPACNMASILVVGKVLGRRTLVTYLASIIGGAIAAGCFIDFALPREWFVPNMLQSADGCCHDEMSWFNVGCTIVLALLLLNVLIRHFMHPDDHCHCGCHDEHDECHCDGECHCHENNHDNNCCSMDEKIEFKIVGMNCTHCRNSALNAIQSIDGVERVDIDLASGRAVVEGHASMDEIKTAVESVGFSIG